MSLSWYDCNICINYQGRFHGVGLGPGSYFLMCFGRLLKDLLIIIHVNPSFPSPSSLSIFVYVGQERILTGITLKKWEKDSKILVGQISDRLLHLFLTGLPKNMYSYGDDHFQTLRQLSKENDRIYGDDFDSMQCDLIEPQPLA